MKQEELVRILSKGVQIKHESELRYVLENKDKFKIESPRVAASRVGLGKNNSEEKIDLLEGLRKGMLNEELDQDQICDLLEQFPIVVTPSKELDFDETSFVVANNLQSINSEVISVTIREWIKKLGIEVNEADIVGAVEFGLEDENKVAVKVGLKGFTGPAFVLANFEYKSDADSSAVRNDIFLNEDSPIRRLLEEKAPKKVMVAINNRKDKEIVAEITKKLKSLSPDSFKEKEELSKYMEQIGLSRPLPFGRVA